MRKMGHCSMRFTLASLARIEEAEKTDSVDFLDDLLCECGARVKARRSPMGAWWTPTLHYPQKAPPSPPRKRDQGKRIPR
jgi:hypothetical protein